MTLKKSILLIEDEIDLAEMIALNLNREGFACRLAHDGKTGLAEARKQRPDLIVLDRMLPAMSGEEVATALRRDPELASIPIIMVSAKTEEADELVGFALGADDYIAKPFSIRALLARINAVLRRAEQPEPSSQRLNMGPFLLDLARHELTVDGVAIAVTATEFRILHTLMTANGRVLSRNKLIDAARGTAVAVTDRTIDVHVASLRKKLGAVGGDRVADWVQTVRGVGYTFRPPTDAPPT
ncbi:MAG: response regulator transcription factor [Planctomycetota bacterium]